MSQEFEEEDVYVLLDFQGKDTSRLFKQSTIYFKMLNLNESKPIVEIGEDVFEGTYEDAIGTNVYFEEAESLPPSQDAFQAATPINLQYLLKQTKILKMEKVGIKPKPVMDMNPTEAVNIDIKDDYRALLEKYKNNELNIDEYITDDKGDDGDSTDRTPLDKSEDEDVEEEEDKEAKETVRSEEWKSTELPARQSSVPEWYSTNNDKTKPKPEQVDLTYTKYLKLQKLAELPTKHKQASETITNQESSDTPLHNIPKNEFIIWKNLIMKKVEQQQINLDINKDKIEDFVDIQGSIQSGIVLASNVTPRIFTKEEKKELLSFKNFINVSPLMKLIMLEDYVQLERSAIQQMNPDHLNEVGEDNCTVGEKLKLLEDFKDELKSYIILRFQDESADIEEFENDMSLLTLSDDEDTNELDYSTSSDEDDENDEEDEEEQNSKSDSEQDQENSNVSDEANRIELDKEDQNLLKQ